MLCALPITCALVCTPSPTHEAGRRSFYWLFNRTRPTFRSCRIPTYVCNGRKCLILLTDLRKQGVYLVDKVGKFKRAVSVLPNEEFWWEARSSDRRREHRKDSLRDSTSALQFLSIRPFPLTELCYHGCGTVGRPVVTSWPRNRCKRPTVPRSNPLSCLPLQVL